MANMPRILTSNVVVPTSRVGVFSSAAKADAIPVEEIDQYSALVNQEASIYYDKLSDEKEGLTEYRKTKAIKAQNIENYRKQFEESGSFEYDGLRNELQLYKNEMAFCSACPDIEINEDDLLEQ